MVGRRLWAGTPAGQRRVFRAAGHRSMSRHLRIRDAPMTRPSARCLRARANPGAPRPCAGAAGRT